MITKYKSNSLLPGTNSMFEFNLRKFRRANASKHYRSLSFQYKTSRIIYRYPFKNDNEQFLLKLAKFIESEIINGKISLEYKHINTFFVGIEDNCIVQIDKNSFDESEKKYVKELKEPVMFY